MAQMNPITASATGDATPAQLARALHIGSLDGKIALITGASSGLGRAIALAYAGAGATVINADLRAEPPPVGRLAKEEGFEGIDLTTPTVELINKHFPNNETGVIRAAFVQCDVTDASSVEAAITFAAHSFGRLDIMVNNAGIAAEIGSQQRTHEQDPSILDKDLAVNTKGTWLGCKYAISQMLAQRPHVSGERGWIINMCSIAGLIGVRGSSAYCASKGAVLQMTKAMAIEYARDRIHVNCINPGFAQTSLLEQLRDEEGKTLRHLASFCPWGRLAMPDDIAKMAVFLAGDGASYVTGAAFLVDGGYTAQ